MINLFLANKYDLAITLTWVIGGIVMLGLFVYLFAVEAPKSIKKERLRRQKVEEEYEKEPEYEFHQAQVVERKKLLHYVGIKMPKQITECKVVFLLESGVTITCYLREELFDKIQDNQQGTLVTVNGNFFDFGDGKEIQEEYQVQEENSGDTANIGN